MDVLDLMQLEINLMVPEERRWFIRSELFTARHLRAAVLFCSVPGKLSWDGGTGRCPVDAAHVHLLLSSTTVLVCTCVIYRPYGSKLVRKCH
jgi:hypothetical protein